MAKPRLIIIVRHAQSEGNKNREIHQTVPDHRVKLTSEGWSQARDAGRRLRNLLRPDDTLHFFTSPYRRTRETTEGMLATLTLDQPEPSPFRRANIKVYEEPRLREQDFGNFQPCGAEMERMWQERADYGRFFYRIPDGESAADAYDRVSGFNESLWRQFGEDDFASVCILVTHGLMSRVFLMKWYHFTVEYFEDLRNVDHCEFLIMRKQDNGKYLLENNLRTWSELRRERDCALGIADAKSATPLPPTLGTARDGLKLERMRTYTVTRRWGGCPNGCNHTSLYTKRHDLEALRQRDNESSKQLNDQKDDLSSGSAVRVVRHNPPRNVSASPFDATSQHRVVCCSSNNLHLGRDFGGSYSGHASAASTNGDDGDDADIAADADANADTDAVANGVDTDADVDADDGAGSDHSRCCHPRCTTVFANRLGDNPFVPGCSAPDDPSPDPEEEEDELGRAEREDRSLRGSVY